MSIPTTAPVVFCLFKDDWSLNDDHIHKFIKPKPSIGRLAEEGIDVVLGLLAMVMQENASGISWINKTTIWSSNRLKDDIITDIMLEETVIGDWFFALFTSHVSLSAVYFIDIKSIIK